MSARLNIYQIPAFNDNYIFLIEEKSSGQVAAVDPGDGKLIKDFLKEKNLPLNFILNTHHHWDHVGGNELLKKEFGCEIYAFKNDAVRIPEADVLLEEGELFSFKDGAQAEVIFTPGHTVGHIVYYFKEDGLLFCGDTLFSMGCGRLFEGTAQQMYESLNKIKRLPQDIKIYCAHEYTLDNGKFALSIDPDNKDLQARMKILKAKREKGEWTVPFLLLDELKTNPFLRTEEMKSILNLNTSSMEDVFAKVRQLKDEF